MKKKIEAATTIINLALIHFTEFNWIQCDSFKHRQLNDRVQQHINRFIEKIALHIKMDDA